MTARLTADFWVRAYLARLQAAHLPAYVTAGRSDGGRGPREARRARRPGAALSAQRRPDDRRARLDRSRRGAEAEVDAAVARQRRTDPDLWVIEVESREGRTLLDEEGLAD